MSGDSTLLLKYSRRLLADYALLVVLDIRRAALQLAVALSAVLVVTVLITTAWLACVGAVIAWVQGHDGLPGALGFAALGNLVAALALGWWVRGRLTEKPFAATLRQLRGELPGEDDEPEQPASGVPT